MINTTQKQILIAIGGLLIILTIGIALFYVRQRLFTRAEPIVLAD